MAKRGRGPAAGPEHQSDVKKMQKPPMGGRAQAEVPKADQVAHLIAPEGQDMAQKTVGVPSDSSLQSPSVPPPNILFWGTFTIYYFHTTKNP